MSLNAMDPNLAGTIHTVLDVWCLLKVLGRQGIWVNFIPSLTLLLWTNHLIILIFSSSSEKVALYLWLTETGGLTMIITVDAHRKYSINNLFLADGSQSRKGKVRVSWQCRAVKIFGSEKREGGRERESDCFPHHPRQVSLPLQNSYSKVFGIYIMPCIFSHIFIL